MIMIQSLMVDRELIIIGIIDRSFPSSNAIYDATDNDHDSIVNRRLAKEVITIGITVKSYFYFIFNKLLTVFCHKLKIFFFFFFFKYDNFLSLILNFCVTLFTDEFFGKI